eukprot:Lankesteria_metandrocarpae@DN4739_c1_g1_i1.p1
MVAGGGSGLTLEKVARNLGNEQCADCKCRGPRWASVNLGLLICIDCAGIHRHLGVHISKVKSLTLDVWQPEWLKIVDSIGNTLSNNYYEHQLPPTYNRPTPDQTKTVLENFIRSKYQKMQWAPLDSPLSPSVLYAQGADPAKCLRRPTVSTGGVSDNTRKSTKSSPASTSLRGGGTQHPVSRRSDRHRGGDRVEDSPRDRTSRRHRKRDGAEASGVPRSRGASSKSTERRTSKTLKSKDKVKVAKPSPTASPPTTSARASLLLDDFTSTRPPMTAKTDKNEILSFFDTGPLLPPPQPNVETTSAFGILIEPPTGADLQDAKIATARESIARLYREGAANKPVMGFGVPSFPVMVPSGFDRSVIPVATSDHGGDTREENANFWNSSTNNVLQHAATPNSRQWVTGVQSVMPVQTVHPVQTVQLRGQNSLQSGSGSWIGSNPSVPVHLSNKQHTAAPEFPTAAFSAPQSQGLTGGQQLQNDAATGVAGVPIAQYGDSRSSDLWGQRGVLLRPAADATFNNMGYVHTGQQTYSKGSSMQRHNNQVLNNLLPVQPVQTGQPVQNYQNTKLIESASLSGFAARDAAVHSIMSQGIFADSSNNAKMDAVVSPSHYAPATPHSTVKNSAYTPEPAPGPTNLDGGSKNALEELDAFSFL